MPNFSFPGRIPFNSVVIGNNVKNFTANNKNISKNGKNIGKNNKNLKNNNKNFSNNKNLKNISQINYPNLKGRAISISVKFPGIIKFSIKFGNTKFPYYIEIKFNIKFKFPYYIKFNTKFPYYIVINIKTNNVIGVRQLQEAKPERNCLTNHQHCSFQDGTQKFLSLRIKFQG